MSEDREPRNLTVDEERVMSDALMAGTKRIAPQSQPIDYTCPSCKHHTWIYVDQSQDVAAAQDTIALLHQTEARCYRVEQDVAELVKLLREAQGSVRGWAHRKELADRIDATLAKYEGKV